MLKIGVLASTKATDLQAVINAIDQKKLDAKITILISDKKDAFAIERAKKNGISAFFVNPQGKQREEYDKEVAEILDQHSVELIFMLGWMRICSAWFVARYKNKIMNIHPSLLPAFAGGMDRNVH